MREKRYISNNYMIIFAIFFMLCATVQAQESSSREKVRLTPDEAVDIALRNNLGLESSRTSLQTRRRASSTSWNQFIPNVTVAGSLMRDNQLQTMTGIQPIPVSPYFTIYSYEVPQWRVAGTIQASVNISLAMFENIRRLRLDYEGGLIGYEKAKKQLERDVRKAYHNMLLLQENIALLRVSFANVERQVAMAQANYNAGLVPELTLLQARVARENMRPVIDQAEGGLHLSMAQFAMYLGMEYDTEFELLPVTDRVEFIPLDIAQLISRAASNRPDIQELRHTILMLESARRAQVFALTPSISVSWNNNWALSDPFKTSWAGSNWINAGGSLTISLALRLHSLIPFSSDFQGIKSMEDQIRTANIGLAQLINGTEIEIYNIVLSLERTRITTEAQAQTVRLAEQAYRLTEQAYQAGLQDYFQVQNAQQSLHQARVQMLEQQFNYLNGLIDLEYSIGVPFGTLSGRRD
jgi:outer membrane protein TolC